MATFGRMVLSHSNVNKLVSRAAIFFSTAFLLFTALVALNAVVRTELINGCDGQEEVF